MQPKLRFALVVSSLLMLASPAFAQPNLEGTWDLQASGVLPSEEEPCVFEGSGEVAQNGNQLTGHVSLVLVSGPDDCPLEMMADLLGTVKGSALFGMLDGGQMFGALDLSGTIATDGSSIQGTYEVKPGGPFSRVTEGTWSATVQRQLSVLEIPTAGPWGLALLAVLLGLTSVVVLRRM